MVKFLTLIILILISFAVKAGTKVRRVTVTKDQIVTIRTALGIATIIQVPDQPSSVVVGDQEGFKVEYLDQAVTIKPLQPEAKTNIYIYTDWQRYNIELLTGPADLCDYVVYLENFKVKDPLPKWIEFKNKLQNDEITLETSRVTKLKNGIIHIEFDLISEKKLSFRPEWIWLTQEGKTKAIHNLILTSLELTPNVKVQGILQLMESDIKTSNPFRIELRRSKLSFLTIKKVDSWK